MALSLIYFQYLLKVHVVQVNFESFFEFVGGLMQAAA